MNFTNKFRKLRKEEGFTLVELIVVIAITAILGGVAVPAYSGYIEKADRAADAQLLADVNKAFAAACMVEGIDNYDADVTAPSVKEDGTLGPITVTGVDDFNTTFENFFDNESAFKSEDVQLYYKQSIGGFANAGDSIYAGLATLLAGADKDALLASIFMNEGAGLGIEGLLNKVNDVTLFAAAADSAALEKVLTSLDFLSFAGEVLGLSPESDEFQDALNARFGALVQEMMDQNPGMSAKDAQKQLRANAAVLYAAKNTSSMTVDSVKTLLGQDGAKNTIKGNLNNQDNTGLALSQAAVAYGMYTAYAYSTGDSELINSTSDPLKILNALDDDGFQSYINDSNNQNDIQAYIDSMGMITTASKDSTSVDGLMVNGFNDPALAAMLGQIISQ